MDEQISQDPEQNQGYDNYGQNIILEKSEISSSSSQKSSILNKEDPISNQQRFNDQVDQSFYQHRQQRIQLNKDIINLQTQANKLIKIYPIKIQKVNSNDNQDNSASSNNSPPKTAFIAGKSSNNTGQIYKDQDRFFNFRKAQIDQNSNFSNYLMNNQQQQQFPRTSHDLDNETTNQRSSFQRDQYQSPSPQKSSSSRRGRNSILKQQYQYQSSSPKKKTQYINNSSSLSNKNYNSPNPQKLASLRKIPNDSPTCSPIRPSPRKSTVIVGLSNQLNQSVQSNSSNKNLLGISQNNISNSFSPTKRNTIYHKALPKSFHDYQRSQMMRRSSVLSDPQSIAAFNSGINQLRNARIAIKNTNNMLVQHQHSSSNNSRNYDDDEDDLNYVEIKQVSLGDGDEVPPTLLIDKEEKEQLHNQITQYREKWNKILDENQKDIQRRLQFSARDQINDKGMSGQIIDNCEGLADDRLSMETIQIVKSEFRKRTVQQRDFFMLNQLLKNLKFFSKFQRGVRTGILEASEFNEFEFNTLIFQQDEEDDQHTPSNQGNKKLYIILRGSVNIKIQTVSNSGDIIDSTTTSFYDGQHFGDANELEVMKASYRLDQGLQQPSQQGGQQDKDKDQGKGKDKARLILQTQNENNLIGKMGKNETFLKKQQRGPCKRVATTITAEKCYILALPSEKYRTILHNSIQPEMEMKIRVLSMVSFLKDAHLDLISPFANAMTVHHYRLGDYILKENEPLSFFGVVASGICQAVIEIREQRDLKSLSVRAKPKFFKYRQHCDRSTNITIKGDRDPKEDQLCQNDDFFFFPEQFMDDRSFQFCNKLKNSSNRLEYTNHIVCKELSTGEYFAGRCLLNQLEQLRKQEKFQNIDKGLAWGGSKSAISLIASSSEVEILKLEPNKFSNFSEALQIFFKEALIDVKEFDMYNIEQKKRETTKWLNHKQNLVREIITKKKLLSRTAY